MTVASLVGHYAPVFAAYRAASDYARFGRVWTEEIGHLPADQVRPHHVEARAARRLRVEGRAPQTVAHEVGYLRTLYRRAVRDALVADNPAEGLRIRVPDNTRIRYLLDEEEPRLRPVMRPRSWRKVEFCLLTGLRSAEQFGMLREQIDWTCQTVNVWHGKGGKGRIIPLSDRAAELLREQLAEHSHDRVWPTSPRSARTMLQRAAIRAGIPHLSWHCLRHTFATRLVRAGVDIRTIADLLGHASIQMTMRYLRLDPRRTRDAVEVLSRWPDRENGG